MSKLISTIVVNWNGRQFLDDCLGSLLAQSHSEQEIILADNGSTDGSINYIRTKFPSVKIISFKQNFGFGGAVNKSVQEARGEYILFLNNDLSLDKNCLEELLKVSQEQNIEVVAPKILLFDQPNTINSFGCGIHFSGIGWPKNIYQKDNPLLQLEEVPVAGLLLIKKKVFEEVGGFDENIFLYHEDSDLCWRLRLLGYRVAVNPKAVVWHKYSFSRNPQKLYLAEKNRLQMILKNYSSKSLLLNMPALLLVEVSVLGWSLVSGWFFKKIKGYFEIIFSLPAILKKRKKIQSRRKVAEREIIKLFEGKLKLHSIKNQFIIEKFLNPLLNGYWRFVKKFI